MRFTFTIESEGAQAEEEPAGMTYDLLRETAAKVDEGYESGTLLDVNGNRVGHWELTA